MAEPLVAATPAPPVPLTRRASLNGIAFALDLGVRTGVGLVLTPLLVDRLGAGLFGVWEMLGRLAGYLAAIGGRPAEALRLVVANRQAAPAADHRRALGAALVVWLIFLPLAVAAGAVIVWVAPAITGAAPALHATLRLALGRRPDQQAAARERRPDPRSGGVAHRRDDVCPHRLRAARGRDDPRQRDGRGHAGAGRVAWGAPVRARAAGATRAPGAHLAVRHRRRHHHPPVEPLVRGPVGQLQPLCGQRRRPVDRPDRGARSEERRVGKECRSRWGEEWSE